MTDYATVLLEQNSARYEEPEFYKSSQFDEISEQLIRAFWGPNQYFYKNSELIEKKPSAINQQIMSFFAPGNEFGTELIKGQELSAPMFASILTDPSVFSSTMYQGSVSNSVFGKFIALLVETCIAARFSVKFDCFELKNYRNCALFLLQKWSNADLSKLNIDKLAALCTGGQTRKIVFLSANEYVPVIALQELFESLPKNSFESCQCQNCTVEELAGDDCAGFTAELLCSNNNALLEICLRALNDCSDAGKYFLQEAAFYLLLEMSKFKHIVKLPTYLEIIKNMNYAMEHGACKRLFSLFYEELSIFLESYLYKLRITYATDAWGKMKFPSKTNFYFKNYTMLFASLDEILIFCQQWREIYEYSYFEACFESKDEILDSVQPFMSIIDNQALATLFKALKASSSTEGYNEQDLMQIIMKVQYRCGQLFDHKTMRIFCNSEIELYREYSDSSSLKSAYLSAIVATFSGDAIRAEPSATASKRTVQLFDVLAVDYAFLNKFAGTIPMEERRAFENEELEYEQRLEESGIHVSQKVSNRIYRRITELSESWEIVLDALRSDLFWLLVIIAGVGIVVVKKLTIWLIS